MLQPAARRPARSVVALAGQRTIGTILGGVLGLAVRFASVFVPLHLHWLLYAATAGTVGATGIAAGEKLPQATAAQLFVITFILVFAEGTSMVRR